MTSEGRNGSQGDNSGAVQVFRLCNGGCTCQQSSARMLRFAHKVYSMFVVKRSIGTGRFVFRPTTRKILAQQTWIPHWKHLLCFQPHLGVSTSARAPRSCQHLAQKCAETDTDPPHIPSSPPQGTGRSLSEHPTKKGRTSVLGDHPQPRGKAARYKLCLEPAQLFISPSLLSTHCFGLQQSPKHSCCKRKCPSHKSLLYWRRMLVKAFENICSLEIKYLKAFLLPPTPSQQQARPKAREHLPASSQPVFTFWPSPSENVPDHEAALWMDDCCPPGTELTSQTSLFLGMRCWSQSKDERLTFPVAHKLLSHLQMFVPQPMFAEQQWGERKSGPVPIPSVLKEQHCCEQCMDDSTWKLSSPWCSYQKPEMGDGIFWNNDDTKLKNCNTTGIWSQLLDLLTAGWELQK